MTTSFRLTMLAGWLLLSAHGCKKATDPAVNPPVTPPATSISFTNPLLPISADPWVTQKDGFYYYMHTTGNNLTLWKTAKMSELGSAVSKVIWSPPSSGAASHDI